MDLGTGLALLGSAKLAEKLLGPTFEYIGEGLKGWTDKGVRNVNRIFSNATKILGDKIEESGTVPPKVLKGILQEGGFCDDSLAAEYFGGVLASSRTNATRDDRGATFIALLGRLSTYQIRTHYIFYYILKRLFDRTRLNPGDKRNKNVMKTYVPISVYVAAMDFQKGEDITVILSHVMAGLQRERLIDEEYVFGSRASMIRHFQLASREGIIFEPSTLGVELFLWAHGNSDVLPEEFLDREYEFGLVDGMTIPKGYEKVPRQY